MDNFLPDNFLSEITFNKFNNIFGIYLDQLNKEKIFITYGNDENSIYIININKYLLKFTLNNLETQSTDGEYYYIDINNHNKNFNVSSYKLKKHDFKVKIIISVDNDNITINLDIFGKNIKLIPIYNFNGLEKIFFSNKSIKTTRGGTRNVYLLDNVVIKENDKNCDIICEQLSNYVAFDNGINVVPFLGIVNYKNRNLLVERKMVPIIWEQCLSDINFYKEIKIKWDIFTKQIKDSKLLGDFNLGNVLMDENNNLIVTDFNGSYKEYFLTLGMILSEENAYNLKVRLSDYYTDPRISPNIFSNKILMFKKIFNNYDTIENNIDSIKKKYVKYKQKYLRIKKHN